MFKTVALRLYSHCDDPQKYCRTYIIKLYERDLNANFIFLGRTRMSWILFSEIIANLLIFNMDISNTMIDDE